MKHEIAQKEGMFHSSVFKDFFPKPPLLWCLPGWMAGWLAAPQHIEPLSSKLCENKME